MGLEVGHSQVALKGDNLGSCFRVNWCRLCMAGRLTWRKFNSTMMEIVIDLYYD